MNHEIILLMKFKTR